MGTDLNHPPAFEGLSQQQLVQLWMDPLAKDSLLQLKAVPPSAVEDLPFLKVAIDIMKAIAVKGKLKTTAKGNLPTKLVAELYLKHTPAYEDAPAHDWVPKKEEESIIIHRARIVARLAGLIRPATGYFHITKTGQKLLDKNDLSAIYQALFVAFCTKFSWAYHPLAWVHQNEIDEERFGQVGYGFSLYLMSRYGETPRPTQFYIDKLLALQPGLTSRIKDTAFSTSKEEAAYLFEKRFWDFCITFGLAQEDRSPQSEPFPIGRDQNLTFSKTPLFHQLLEFKI